MVFFGYRYRVDGKHFPAIRLEDQSAVEQFIRENLEEPQIIITDGQDRQLLLMRDRVDLFNELDQIGISLYAVINEVPDETIDGDFKSQEKPKWERLYDQIGLSPGEINMRQRVKAACRAAQTVQDAADLVSGTYFDAHFITRDGQMWFRFFDEDDFSVTAMKKDSSGNWADVDKKIHLSPEARIKHLRSSEDIHTFEFIDKPDI